MHAQLHSPRPTGRLIAIGIILAAALMLALNDSRSSAKDAAKPSVKEPAKTTVYKNVLTPLKNPQPLLADHPEFVQPVAEVRRFEALAILDEKEPTSTWGLALLVQRRGIIEMPNRLRARETAVIMVHPWGIDDGQGWRTPEPAGVADFARSKRIISPGDTPAK
jgi:hypothetical protein